MKTSSSVVGRSSKELTVFILITISLTLLFTVPSKVEARSNKEDIKREVEDGRTVAWGEEIDHWEYAELLTTITAAYVTANPWLLYDYFTDLLSDMITDLGTSVILKALENRDAIWVEGEFEIQGGIATFDHWHDENPCSAWGGECWIKVDEPNTHQPYVRWRRAERELAPEESSPPDPVEPSGPDSLEPSETPEGSLAAAVVKDKEEKAVLLLLNQYLLNGF